MSIAYGNCHHYMFRCDFCGYWVNWDLLQPGYPMAGWPTFHEAVVGAINLGWTVQGCRDNRILLKCPKCIEEHKTTVIENTESVIKD